jgi:hypothetical protein
MMASGLQDTLINVESCIPKDKLGLIMILTSQMLAKKLVSTPSWVSILKVKILKMGC